MASRKKSASRGVKRTSIRKKSSVRKTSGHSAGSRSSRNSLVVRNGNVYVFSRSGVKRANSHVARKASAGEIRTSIGLSGKQASGARSLLARLEKEGLIAKY